MIIKKGNERYFLNFLDAVDSIEKCILLIRNFHPWLERWEEFHSLAKNSVYAVKGNDGLTYWELIVIEEGDLPYIVVKSYGDDQNSYSWIIPDGTEEEVIENHVRARKIDIENGLIWEQLERSER